MEEIKELQRKQKTLVEQLFEAQKVEQEQLAEQQGSLRINCRSIIKVR